MKSVSGTFYLPLLALCLVTTPATTQEWTRFRGPNGSGVSDAESIPVRWSENDYNWKAELPGTGHSQPVIWGEKIFLTGAENDGARRSVICLSVKTGDILWNKSLDLRSHSKHQRNSYASSTATVDEARVYAIFATPDSYHVTAMDHDGGLAWSRNLGQFNGRHGQGASPILFEDLLVVPNEQDSGSFVVALDRATGKTRWETERRSAKAAYGTPCLYRGKNGPEIIFTSMAHGISSLDARTGKPLWEAPLFDKRTCSSPVVAGDLLLGTCGSGGGGNYLVAVRAGGEGDVSGSHLAYKLRNSIPYVPTPIFKNGRVFLWSDRGVASCVNAASGDVIWQERVDGNYSGSPVCVQDRLYCISDDGEVVVIAAADRFQVLARNPLGERSRSTPAVAGGRLYLRTERHLFSVGGKKQPES